MPSKATVLGWLKDSSKREFLDQYRVARSISYDVLAELILDIARGDRSNDDNVKINRDKLEIWATQWYLGKMAPKKYGDKVQEEVAPASTRNYTLLTEEQQDLLEDLLTKTEKDD